MEQNSERTVKGGAFGSKENLLVVIVMILGVFVAILNETLLNVALPKIMGDLEILPSTAQWLSTGYLLVIGVLIPVTAFLIERFTTRMLFLSAMGLFAIGTGVAAIAPNFMALLIGRVLQASGTGLLLPLLMNVVFVMVPLHKRGSAMGTIGIVITFAPAIGPTVSGIVVEHFSWRTLFYGVLPIALFVLLFAYFKLKNVTEVSRPTIDFRSLILSTIGFGGIVYGFSSAGAEDVTWSSVGVWLPIVIGIASLVFFTRRQLKMEKPMLNLRVFQNSIFSLSTLILMIVMMAMFSSMILLPIYLQQGLGYSSSSVGFVMLPGGILMGIMSPITGRLFDRFGAKWLAIIGLGLMGMSLLRFAFITAATPYFQIVLFNTFMMLGISMLMMPVMTNALNQLPSRLYPHGTAVINTLQQVSGAIGTALLVSVMSTSEARYLANESAGATPDPQLLIQAMTVGMKTAFLLAFTLVLVAWLGSFKINRTTVSTTEEPSGQPNEGVV
ncbi:multidrug MFS transporter [Ammoniphilus oxalaticus]|uniref:Multidrug MFS transporter n=1 Tax=Ammoniphilus oxalaticus TaxID=66863 RepID=A0A419SML3_9BACL|nr:MDR family MFS transporter [Ammoniphilus oxalaticus]RKD25546.1 multidrug MFS transporter [Ammoniphilus oxalaticus]